MSTKIAIACCALGALIGVGATWLVARPGDAARDERPAERATLADRAAAVRIEARTGLRAADLRAVVAEEVRAALREQAPSAAAAPAGGAPTKAAITEAAESTPAFEQARGRVAERVAQGTWTAADRDWMRGALGAVSDAERTELMRQVIVAANTGAVRVDLVGPLF
jgi:hypothetical protein